MHACRSTLEDPTDVERRESEPFHFAIVAPPPADTGDPARDFAAMMDFGAQDQARRKAVNDAFARIRAARQAGADLFLANFASADLRPLFAEASDLVDAWIEGAEEATTDFRRRVLLAEGFYVALCEAALEEQPKLGVQLWRALRKVGMLKLMGRARVPELVHIPFRVRQTTESDQILEDLLGLENTNTDKDLLDIALAAGTNGRQAWLEQVIEGDETSGITWRERRAEVLSGFGIENSLPVDEAWPEGETRGASYRRYQAARWRLSAASARHWWEAYLAAPDAASANAAWVLFLACADRRALAWVRDELPEWRSGDRLQKLKRAHAIFNYAALVRASEKREKPLADTFLGQKIFRGIGPWT